MSRCVHSEITTTGALPQTPISIPQDPQNCTESQDDTVIQETVLLISLAAGQTLPNFAS